jgi:hypothetical protein
VTAETSDEVASSSKGSRAEKALVAPRVCIVSSKALDVSSKLCWLLPGEQWEGKRERAKACRNLDKQSQPEKQKVVGRPATSRSFSKKRRAHISLLLFLPELLFWSSPRLPLSRKRRTSCTANIADCNRDVTLGQSDGIGREKRGEFAFDFPRLVCCCPPPPLFLFVLVAPHDERNPGKRATEDTEWNLQAAVGLQRTSHGAEKAGRCSPFFFLLRYP